MIDTLYFHNVAQIQIEIKVCSVLADLSHKVLTVGSVSSRF